MITRPLLVVVSVTMLLTSILLNRSTAAQASPRKIEVSASKFSFSPGEITLKKNQPVVLELKSTDVAHGLKFSELNLNVKFNKTKPAEMSFTPSKTGDFVGQCSSFCGSGHAGMKLTLHVVE